MKKERQPNILLLHTDQQRFDTIAACGYPYMLTPHLDRLVKEGCCFKNAYTPNPICIPARLNVITGLPARFHGLAMNDDNLIPANIPTLPRILSDNGYLTAAIGKMHFRPPRSHHGFNRMELMEEIPQYREDDEYAMYLKENGWGHIRNIHGVRNLLYMTPQRSLIPEEHHGSIWVGKRTANFIKTEAGRRPFFLSVGWIAPHPPFDVPESFAHLYRNRTIPAPFSSRTPLSPRAARAWVWADLPKGREKKYLRRTRELYYSAISLVDKAVGLILAALEETGQLENTFIIFTSDHGEMLGDHGCFQKMSPYESSSHIPMIMRFPRRIKPGTRRKEFVDLNDILPTILDVAGIRYPGAFELPGGSVFQNSKDRQYQFIEYGRGIYRWIAVRDQRYKYCYHYEAGFEEMFDLVKDPHETTNLLHGRVRGQIIGIKDRLKGALYQFEVKWGLPHYAADGEFLLLEKRSTFPEGKRNGQFPVFPENIRDPVEKKKMNDFADEVFDAIKDEKTVDFNELDLAAWRRNGVCVETIKKIRRQLRAYQN